jgi:ATP-binding cassette subfamily F protein 3
MLVEATQLTKSIGSKDLFSDLSFYVEHGEKIALIGRNGQGKTTLLKMLAGLDTDYHGTITAKKNLRVTLTRQEHFADADCSALHYILDSVPDYFRYKDVLDGFERGDHTDIHRYTETLDRFTNLGYFYVEDRILNTLSGFQITPDQARLPLSALSGGEKRYVELARLMYSAADLYLIDEPTNHMDYIGKDQFIAWMREEEHSIVVVTHDRDVLKYVDKIVELKDKKMTVFTGNYDKYLDQNAAQTTNSVKQYQVQLHRLRDAKKRLEWGLQMRAKSKEWKIRYEHWLRDYETIKAQTVKPSFWIDQDSAESLDRTVAESYRKFKEKNISIAIHAAKEHADELLTVRNLSLGYGTPLFSGLHCSLRNDDRIFIKGRNGAGKSTFVRTIMSAYRQQQPQATVYDGEIHLGPMLRIGEYEQEIGGKYLRLTLEEGIKTVYEELELPMGETLLRSLLAQYLFDPMVDGKQKIADLSGGQKARFQLIRMLACKPNLLILDEPTNHLDLPSIEELENALGAYQGGILYISHDTYFIDHIGGETVEI